MRMRCLRGCRHGVAAGLALLTALAAHAQADRVPPGPAPPGAWYVGANGQAIESGTDAIAYLGMGGEWELLPPRRLLLRSELRFRYDFNDTDQPGQEGFGDAIFSLGLMLPFGR